MIKYRPTHGATDGELRTGIPRKILAGKYEVEAILGQGGMGVVVAARHIQLRQRVALKFLLPKVLDNPELISRFLREAQAASRISSEHVARVLDMGTLADGCPFMVMEYLEGNDLSKVLRKAGPLPIPVAVEYVLQACEALAEAHGAGIIHRDIKPANLFLTHRADGSPLVKVLDFGVSKTVDADGDGALTRTDAAMMGSPSYMSPEQIRSQKSVDARSDIWSLGVVLYELLSARLPFAGENLGALIASILSDTPPPLRTLRPDLPPALGDLAHACMSKKPAERPASIAAFAQQLMPFGGVRAALSVERITGVHARSSAGFNLPAAPAALAIAAPHVAYGPHDTVVESSHGTQTSGSWDKPRDRPQGGRRGLAVGLALAALGGGAVIVLLVLRPWSHAPATAASAAPPPSAAAATADPAPFAAPSASVASAPVASAPVASAQAAPSAPVASAQAVPSAQAQVDAKRRPGPTGPVGTAKPSGPGGFGKLIEQRK